MGSRSVCPMPFMADLAFRDQIIRKALDAQHRVSFAVTRAEATGDEDDRTLRIVCATDKPITHFLWSQWEYVDIALVMDSGAMRPERFNAGAAFLMDHNTRDQRGVIESFEIKNGELLADIRMSRSERGKELYHDMRDGIRQQISLGFMIHELTLVKQREGQPDLYEARDWEPYEASSVSVAADLDAKVLRAIAARRDGMTECPECEEPLEGCTCEQSESASEARKQRAVNHQLENQMSKELEMPPDSPVETPRSAAQAEIERVNDFIAFGRCFGTEYEEVARDLAATSKDATIDDLRSRIDEIRRAKLTTPPPTTDPADVAARQSAANGQDAPLEFAHSIRRYGSLKGFTGPDAERKAFRFGHFVLGSILGNERSRDLCKQHGISLTRAQSEGINEKGGYLVPDEFGNDMIDLIERYGVFRQHAKIVPMTSDTRSDPRIVGDPEAYFVAESSTITEGDFEVDRVNLTAKKLATRVPYSSEVSEDAVISLGDELARLSARAFAKKEDECGFNGDGTSTYGGIVGARERLLGLSGTIANIAGLQVGTGNAYSELVLGDFNGVVARLPEYADANAKWYVSRGFYWNVMVRALFAANGTSATEIENTRNQLFMGYPVVFAQVMPKTEANSQVCALFGDLSMGASFGDRRTYSIALSEHVRFNEDDIVFRATERFDINVHSVGNASANAADRVAGPIVGLITAAS